MDPLFDVASGTAIARSAAGQVSTGLVAILTFIVVIIVGYWAYKFGKRKLMGSVR